MFNAALEHVYTRIGQLVPNPVSVLRLVLLVARTNVIRCVGLLELDRVQHPALPNAVDQIEEREQDAIAHLEKMHFKLVSPRLVRRYKTADFLISRNQN